MTTKKLTARQLRSLILEEASNTTEDSTFVKVMLDEEADPSKFDFEKFPLKLTQSAKAAGGKDGAEKLVGAGLEDGEQSDDVVAASGGGFPVRDLKPSQTSMDINKAAAFAIAAILKTKPFPEGPGGDLSAIISSDQHIMDGHHRWIASGMVDPDASVSGEVVDFPAKQLIAALNMVTVALTGRESGKAATGDFSQFTEAGIKSTLEKYAKEGVWSAGGDPEKVVAALEEFSGEKGDAAIEASAKKMADNIAQLQTDVPADFPSRPDMPVISPGEGHVAQAVALLQRGAVDLNPPFKDAGEEKNEGSITQDEVIMEHWRILAGI